jgi:phage gpG-like protein
MIEIEVQGAREIAAAFEELAAHVRDFRPRIWPKINERFSEIMIEQFATGGGAGASGTWAPIGKAYGAWKELHYPGKPILQLTGTLYESLASGASAYSVHNETPDSFERGTTVQYAGFHQKGTKNMPARPPIDLTDEQVESFRDIAMLEFEAIAIELGFEVSAG